MYTENTEKKKKKTCHSSFIYFFSNILHGPIVMSLLPSSTTSSRAWACCSVWKALLPWLTPSLHSHLYSVATNSERTFLVLLSKRLAVFKLCLFLCIIFLHSFHCYLLDISPEGWDFDVFVAASLALGLCLLKRIE